MVAKSDKIRTYNPEKHPVDISIVLPLYNEESNIRAVYAETSGVMDDLGCLYEIIFVDDGSTDSSRAVLDAISIKDPCVTVLRHRRNFGKGAALETGFTEASGRIVVTMDADLQDNPADIPRLVEHLQAGYDLVSGWKVKRKDPLSKTVPSKIFNKVVALSTGLKLHDFNCGIKAYRRELTDRLHIQGDLYRYIPVLAHSAGFRVTEARVDNRPRGGGVSKYGRERYIRGFMDLLTVLFVTRYAKRPLHLFGPVGIGLLISGLLINVHLSLLWLEGHNIGHRPLPVLGILLMVIGGQFVSTGLICEMITRAQKQDDEGRVSQRVRKGRVE